MSHPTRLTDDQITAMLLERSSSPMPLDLPTVVLASVAEARHRQDRQLGRGPSRPVSLLVAAALVIGGSLLVSSFAGSRLTTPTPALIEASPTTAAVKQVWVTDGSPAFTVTRDPWDTSNLYWRAVAWDRIELTGYGLSPTKSIARPAAADVFDQLADDVQAIRGRTLTFTITPAGFRAATILSPATPVSVREGTNLIVVGRDGYYSSLERDGGTGPYTVTAVIAEPGNAPGQLNTAVLRASGRDYPSEVLSLYTHVEPGSLGENARSLEARVLENARSDAPVDIASALFDLLRSSEFRYSVDVRDLDCAGASTVECFATFKVGFCQHYAITMAVILRDLGIPTRIVEGFLPGSREQSGSVEVVANRGAHTWVEVYFNGVGWVMYDPTGGQATQLPLPTGAPAAASPSGSEPAP
jgi:transglutaminase-like putative cysteine protease